MACLLRCSACCYRTAAGVVDYVCYDVMMLWCFAAVRSVLICNTTRRDDALRDSVALRVGVPRCDLMICCAVVMYMNCDVVAGVVFRCVMLCVQLRVDCYLCYIID